MTEHNTIVLGAGLTGLSFAYHYDRDIPIFEANDAVGGMVRTIDVNGFKFDLAPHLLHLRLDYVKDLVFGTLGLKAQSHKRNSCIYYEDRIIPYPFELNLYNLSEKTKQECLKDVPDKETIKRINEQELRSGSYRDYTVAAFGRGIADHYLLPYNRKIWDTDPSEMTCEWMRYLPTADVDKIRENALKPNTEAFGYNTEFYYPHENGIQDLANAFANQLQGIHLGQAVTGISTNDKTIQLSNGETIGYNHAVSTLPLASLIEISDLDHLKETARQLVYTSVYTVNIVINGDTPKGVHWMYFPDPELIFYRISFPKQYFQRSTPDNEHIIAVEVGSRDHSLQADDLTENVVSQIKKIPIFKIKEIYFTHCIKIPVAYCIYDKYRTKVVEKLRQELEDVGITSIGRYGQWEYSAMQDAILYGKELAEKLK